MNKFLSFSKLVVESVALFGAIISILFLFRQVALYFFPIIINL